MASHPIVFGGTASDLELAFSDVRTTVASMPEPRLYAAAFVLAVGCRAGWITWWRDWTGPAPAPVAAPATRKMVEDAMWSAFGFEATSILKPGSQPLVALGNPEKVLVDPFFDPQHPEVLTMVRPGTPKTRNSLKVPIDHPAWIWGAGSPSQPLPTPVEYQTGNTFNQQNGVRCALPASSAIAAGNPHGQYATDRIHCPNFASANRCTINNEDCASDGAGGTRIPKPRVIVPSAAGGAYLLTPSSFDETIDRAREDKQTGVLTPLPKAQDLALLVGWAERGDGRRLTFGRLMGLLGPELLRLLSEP